MGDNICFGPSQRPVYRDRLLKLSLIPTIILGVRVVTSALSALLLWLLPWIGIHSSEGLLSTLAQVKGDTLADVTSPVSEIGVDLVNASSAFGTEVPVGVY